MLRQRDIAHGSSLGEQYLYTGYVPTPANDYGEVFVFPRATRIWITELGVSASTVFTGTSMAADIAYLAAGLVGTEDPVQDGLTGGYTSAYTHDGVATYELTATGFRVERCATHQPYLVEITDADCLGQNGWDNETNIHFRLATINTGMSSISQGFAWCRAKIWYREDE